MAQQHPQLCRQEWLDLTGQWLFAYDDEDRGLSEHWERPRDNPAEIFDRTITVPYPPESEASGINDPSFHPICWYYRALTDAEISTQLLSALSTTLPTSHSRAANRTGKPNHTQFGTGAPLESGSPSGSNASSPCTSPASGGAPLSTMPPCAPDAGW